MKRIHCHRQLRKVFGFLGTASHYTDKKKRYTLLFAVGESNLKNCNTRREKSGYETLYRINIMNIKGSERNKWSVAFHTEYSQSFPMLVCCKVKHLICSLCSNRYLVEYTSAIR